MKVEGSREFVQFDLSKVPALEEKRAERRTGMLEGFKAGGVTREEFRLAWGLEAQPGDDVYLVPFSAITVPSDGSPPPAPKPAGDATPSPEELEGEQGKKVFAPVLPGD